jgi:hypothetical protein
MEVRLFPNSARPGVGLPPRRESQRPLLPQHARHCPVLEAGSSVGYLVYPPLADNEAYYIEYQGDGQYQFVFYMGDLGNSPQPVFSVTVALPVGSVGITKEHVEFHVKDTPISSEGARKMARIFIVPEDLGTPTGGVSIRGATNFQTPAGWDTIYTPIFNNIERPVAPMLVVRVETDWYAHETEFRYVLQPGEGIHGSHHLPIGQVLFVPREDVVFRDCNEEELAAIKQSKSEFFRKKAALTLTTPYGFQYSPYYARESRAQKAQDRD